MPQTRTDAWDWLLGFPFPKWNCCAQEWASTGNNELETSTTTAADNTKEAFTLTAKWKCSWLCSNLLLGLPGWVSKRKQKIDLVRAGLMNPGNWRVDPIGWLKCFKDAQTMKHMQNACSAQEWRWLNEVAMCSREPRPRHKKYTRCKCAIWLSFQAQKAGRAGLANDLRPCSWPKAVLATKTFHAKFVLGGWQGETAGRILMSQALRNHLSIKNEVALPMLNATRCWHGSEEVPF